MAYGLLKVFQRMSLIVMAVILMRSRTFIFADQNPLELSMQ